MREKHPCYLLPLLAFLLLQSFLMGEAVAAPPKKSVEEILKIFEEKQKWAESLMLSLETIRAKPGVQILQKNEYIESYEFPPGGWIGLGGTNTPPPLSPPRKSITFTFNVVVQ